VWREVSTQNGWKKLPEWLKKEAGQNQVDKLHLPFVSLPDLLFLATLALLNHLSLARVIPVSGPARCLSQSRNLLKTTDDMVKTVSFSCPSGFKVPLLT
jgi:hypothetical protein